MAWPSFDIRLSVSSLAAFRPSVSLFLPEPTIWPTESSASANASRPSWTSSSSSFMRSLRFVIFSLATPMAFSTRERASSISVSSFSIAVFSRSSMASDSSCRLCSRSAAKASRASSTCSNRSLALASVSSKYSMTSSAFSLTASPCSIVSFTPGMSGGMASLTSAHDLNNAVSHFDSSLKPLELV